MNRNVQIMNWNRLLATMEISYEKEETGNARITIYDLIPTKPGWPDSLVPLLTVNIPYTHPWLDSFEVIRSYDTNLVYDVFTQLKPEYLQLHYDLHYGQGALHTRYVSLYQGRVTGIADFIDDFMGNKSVVHYTSAVRTHEDQTIHSDRYSYHNTLLAQLADPHLVSWSVVI